MQIQMIEETPIWYILVFNLDHLPPRPVQGKSKRIQPKHELLGSALRFNW